AHRPRQVPGVVVHLRVLGIRNREGQYLVQREVVGPLTLPVLVGTRVVRRVAAARDRPVTSSQTPETSRSRELIVSPGRVGVPANRKGLVQEEGADAAVSAFSKIVAAVLMQRLDPIALEVLWSRRPFTWALREFHQRTQKHHRRGLPVLDSHGIRLPGD